MILGDTKFDSRQAKSGPNLSLLKTSAFCEKLNLGSGLKVSPRWLSSNPCQMLNRKVQMNGGHATATRKVFFNQQAMAGPLSGYTIE